MSPLNTECFYKPNTWFSAKYNKTHKSRLKHEIKCDLYQIWPKNKKTYIFDLRFFSFFLNLGFFRSHFPALTVGEPYGHPRWGMGHEIYLLVVNADETLLLLVFEYTTLMIIIIGPVTINNNNNILKLLVIGLHWWWQSTLYAPRPPTHFCDIVSPGNASGDSSFEWDYA